MRRGENLHVKVEIDDNVAKCGGSVEVSTFGGPVNISIPRGTRSGTVIRAAGRGMPILGSRVNFGDLVVMLEVTASRFRYLKRSEWVTLPKLAHPAGYIYLVHDTELSGSFKIGRTTFPKYCFNEFLTPRPVDTKVVCVLQASNAVSLERELLQRYAMSRRKGDWFDLSDAQVEQICNCDSESIQPPNPSKYTAQHNLGVATVTSHGRKRDKRLPGTTSGQLKLTTKTSWLRLFLYLAAMLFAIHMAAIASIMLSAGRSGHYPTNQPARSKGLTNASSRDSSAYSLYVSTADNMPALFRSCPRRSDVCPVLGGLLPGDEIRPTGTLAGESIKGNDKWITFVQGRQNVYMHSGLLAQSRIATPVYCVHSQNSATVRVRSCPYTTNACTVIAGLLPGEDIRPKAAALGETIAANPIWIAFQLKGKTVYVHGSLVTSCP